MIREDNGNGTCFSGRMQSPCNYDLGQMDPHMSIMP